MKQGKAHPQISPLDFSIMPEDLNGLDPRTKELYRLIRELSLELLSEKNHECRSDQVNPTRSYCTVGEFVEDMSKKNIGRPSTYASVIETLMKKGWIEVDIDIFEIRLTPKGVHIADILETSGHAEASWQFSSKLEKSLSMVENGEIPLEDLIWLYTGIRIGV